MPNLPFCPSNKVDLIWWTKTWKMLCMYVSRFIESLSHPCLSVWCCVSGCVWAPHYGWSAPAVAHYWGYLRSANTPLIVRSSKILCVPVLLLVLSSEVFRSPRWLWRVLRVDLAAHCIPATLFPPRCARALKLPATLLDINKLLFIRYWILCLDFRTECPSTI